MEDLGEEEEDPNKAPRKGIPDIDRKGTVRTVAKDVADVALDRVKWENVEKMAEKSGLNRIGGMGTFCISYVCSCSHLRVQTVWA